MKTFLLYLFLLTSVMFAGCGESYIRFYDNRPLDSNDPNRPIGQIEAKGQAADTLAKQFACNLQTEQGRLAELFKYNSLVFMVLFFVLIGGVVFAVLTKSSWGWIIPTAAGGGLALLVFVVQAAEYIKWIGLGIVVIALGVLIYKAWQYQAERNKLIKEKTV
jgi:hypothetical protein